VCVCVCARARVHAACAVAAAPRGAGGRATVRCPPIRYTSSDRRCSAQRACARPRAGSAGAMPPVLPKGVGHERAPEEGGGGAAHAHAVRVATEGGLPDAPGSGALRAVSASIPANESHFVILSVTVRPDKPHITLNPNSSAARHRRQQGRPALTYAARTGIGRQEGAGGLSPLVCC
jgi:hypothetical protein